MRALEDDFDRPKEECGVVGFWTHPEMKAEVARMAFFSLYALQHRGQESAGMAVSDGNLVTMHKGMGLVSQVFDETAMTNLKGHFGIGHNRYSTTGDSHVRNAQPYHVSTLHGPLSVAHNGNVTNAAALRKALMERGVGLMSTSDTEVITQYLAAPVPFKDRTAPRWEQRLAQLLDVAEGAYSLVVMTRDCLYAMRDPLGMRPLCLGRLKNRDGKVMGWMVASESSALLTLGAKHLREVGPGEIIRIDKNGITTVKPPVAEKSTAMCIFEHVYFARPDSKIEGQTVQVVRQRMGTQLAKEAPAEADVVFGVPDSSLPSAMAYAEATGLPQTEGLIKNRYIGRTFIEPTQEMRENKVRLKFNALRENLEGKRVVMIDDSIVRGTTMYQLVRLVREAGKAKEVHVRIASPPINNPCYMGVDLASREHLMAAQMDVDAMCKAIGADSLAFLSPEGLHKAVRGDEPKPCGHCDACFTGNYPVDVSFFEESDAKRQFEL